MHATAFIIQACIFALVCATLATLGSTILLCLHLTIASHQILPIPPGLVSPRACRAGAPAHAALQLQHPWWKEDGQGSCICNLLSIRYLWSHPSCKEKIQRSRATRQLPSPHMHPWWREAGQLFRAPDTSFQSSSGCTRSSFQEKKLVNGLAPDTCSQIFSGCVSNLSTLMLSTLIS